MGNCEENFLTNFDNYTHDYQLFCIGIDNGTDSSNKSLFYYSFEPTNNDFYCEIKKHNFQSNIKKI